MKFEKSYIVSLYSGEIRSLDKLIPQTKGYQRMEAEIDRILDKLKPAGDEKVLEAVNTLLELTSVQTSEYGEICFELGFKHGVRLMTEVTDAPQSNDVLERLYCGEIPPAGEIARSDEYWRGSKEYNRLQDEFIASLDDEQRCKYMALCDALHTWQSVSDKELYCTGLKYGAKISSALK
jgi:hypothetical protein